MEFLTTLQSPLDASKPSLFELLSEQQLAGLLPPSLRYLLALATHRHPRYLLRVLNSFDEIYALLSLLVERHYLKTYGGGFTENFYGLKRERVLRIRGGEVKRAQLGAPSEVREVLGLRNGDVWRNLLVMVGIPYLKRKLDEGYDIHASGVNLLGPAYRDRERWPANESLKKKVLWLYKWFLRNVYPGVNAAYYFSLLAFNLAYLFDGSKYHSPFLWLIGTRMRRLGEADYRAIALATKPAPAAPGGRPGPTSPFAPRTIGPRLLSSLRILLPTSIFALKFLEWWHASDFARQLSRKTNEGVQLPPPTITLSLQAQGQPARRDVAGGEGKKEGARSRADSGISAPPLSSTTGLPILTVPAPSTGGGEANTTSACPICLTNPIQTPTASPSGYVYCYTCIHRWVEGRHARQEAFMEGSKDSDEAAAAAVWVEEGEDGGSRVGKWGSGEGRDPVTGRRVLGGVGGLRRVMV